MPNDEIVKISIIIPLYNAKKYLAKCLDSILQQDFRALEIIIVDDGSTDNSSRIYLEYEQKDTRIKHIKTENLGSGNARNVGLQNAAGKYTFFCDPDDWVENNIFSDNYKIAEETNADAVFFGVNNYFYNAKNNTYSLSGKRVVNKENPSFREQYADLYFEGLTNSVWNKLYRTKFLKDNEFTFPSYAQGQDLSFNLQVYQKLVKVAYNTNCYYNYVKYSNHTAITRYIHDKTEIYNHLNREYAAMFASWNIPHDAEHKAQQTDIQKVLFDFWFKAICSQLRNIFHFDSPDSHKKKILKCKEILNNPEVQQKLGKIPNNLQFQKKDKLYLFFIKHKLHIGIQFETDLRQFAKQYLVGLYTKIKG